MCLGLTYGATLSTSVVNAASSFNWILINNNKKFVTSLLFNLHFLFPHLPSEVKKKNACQLLYYFVMCTHKISC